MSNPVSGAVRSLRAALLGAVCVTLALTGHLLGGGRPPSLWALLLLSVPMGAVALGVTARRPRLPAIGLTVAASQVLLHEAFMWSAAGAGCVVNGGQHAHLGHVAAGPLLHCGAMPAMSTSGTVGHFAPTAMLLAHAVAGLVTTVVLAYGETLLWRAWERVLRLPQVVVGPLAAPRPTTVAVQPSVRRVRLVAELTRRRGPPTTAAVAG